MSCVSLICTTVCNVILYTSTYMYISSAYVYMYMYNICSYTNVGSQLCTVYMYMYMYDVPHLNSLCHISNTVSIRTYTCTPTFCTYTVLQNKSVDFFIKLHADLFTCTINKNGSYMD